MNPYVYDRPLTQREQFHGRRSEIVRIYSRIAADRPQSVSIVGEPRVGKTSLLNWLYHEGSRTEYIEDLSAYVYLLLFLKEGTPDDPAAFFEQLGLALREADQGDMEPSYAGLTHLVERLMKEGRKLVLFCDDFGLVTQSTGFPLEFFSFMRSVANNNDVAYVMTSSAPLQTLCASSDLEESPFFNIFSTVILRPFSDKEACAFLQEGGVSEEEADWILALAGGSPYLLQLTASLAADAQAEKALDKDVVADRVFAEAQPFLELLWQENLSPAQKKVLQLICKGEALEPRNEYAAKELERGGHLRSTGDGYEIRSDLLKRFVAEAKGGGFWRRLFGA